MRITSVGRALPPHHYDQETLISAFRAQWGARHHNIERLVALHRNVLVGGRNLALPMEDYAKLESFGDANDAWIRVALDVGEAAIEDALEKSGLTAGEVDSLIFVSVTGIATPSIDARLINRMGLSPNTRRLPLFGLGCVAGAAGISRSFDQVRSHPGSVCVLLSVELCSLTLQRDDLSVPNLISSGLFGDGAAAVVMVGEDHPLAKASSGPRVLSTRSVFYPDTERVMGWDISERGFKVILSADVPGIAAENLPRDVDQFLSDHQLKRQDIHSWICHPGGPKVLEALQSGLDLPEGALDLTWKSLNEVGNLSSSSVLMVLGDTLDTEPPPGSYGLLLAMGPGFCCELVLLQW
ncbi:MAG: 3-oxoacyl-[acyl-carrier-protein] synthase III C-terminal domain-containing protein [Myxococcota bacterium]|nr:3-oxoacyl-[acyl-carrier-protein] synthase III C-terminal domain-containing protein [Myxococcota bacterium]